MKYRVELKTPRGKKLLEVGEDEYILDAAFKEGLDLPHTCLQGWCTTCCARILNNGQVDQSDARRVYPEDQEARFVLLCSAKPRSNLKIKTHQQRALQRLRKRKGLPTPEA